MVKFRKEIIIKYFPELIFIIVIMIVFLLLFPTNKKPILAFNSYSENYYSDITDNYYLFIEYPLINRQENAEINDFIEDLKTSFSEEGYRLVSYQETLFKNQFTSIDFFSAEALLETELEYKHHRSYVFDDQGKSYQLTDIFEIEILEFLAVKSREKAIASGVNKLEAMQEYTADFETFKNFSLQKDHLVIYLPNLEELKIDFKEIKYYLKGNFIEDNYLQKSFPLTKVRYLDLNKPMVALTFDDGPSYNTLKIIEKLDKYDAKATFFVLGNRISGREEIIQKVFSAGHEIGNHSFSHPNFNRLKIEEVQAEITKTDQAVQSITETKPRFVRAPYGNISKKYLELVPRTFIDWNVDSEDWYSRNQKDIHQQIMENISDGSIILLHDLYETTTLALDEVLPQLIKKEYQFVTVSELFEYKGVNPQSSKVYRGIQ